MTVWFTSDLHFGHSNIIGYSGRPFADVRGMDRGLVERWNDVVRPDDTIWVLGDLAMGNIADSLALVGELAGHKRLVTGNHDRCWYGHRRHADVAKIEMWAVRYLDAGFEEIHQGKITIDVGGRRVDVCHFPYAGDSHDLDRYVDERPIDGGGWLLHGHVHERWRQRQRMINVGVDAWDYRPVDTPTLVALMEQGPADLERLPATSRSAQISVN